MSHTNSTTNYGLPQFITTDKPAWLTDINNAFLDIDTGLNTAKTTADTAATDAGTAISDAANAQSTANGAAATASGAVASIADAFDATAIYAVGDRVMYNGLFYECTVAVVTPGPWTGAVNWTRITVEQLIDAINTAENYQVGDNISIRYMVFAGIITSSGKKITFFIPTAKPIDSAVSDANISGSTYRIYDNTSNDQLNISDGTWTFTMRPDGIGVQIDFANALSMNNAINVYFSPNTNLELV